MSDKILKVFRVSDYEWWADYSAEEAEKNFLKFVNWTPDYNEDKEDYVYEDGPVELSEETLNRLFFRQEGVVQRKTFKEYLETLDKPQFFATTEE